jgi:hypothetical protein
VLLGASAVTGILALGAASDRDGMKESLGVTREELTAANHKAVVLGVTTDVLAGASLLVGGLALYLTVSSSSSPTRTAVPPVGLGVGPAGVVARGRF